MIIMKVESSHTGFSPETGPNKAFLQGAGQQGYPRMNKYSITDWVGPRELLKMALAS